MRLLLLSYILILVGCSSEQSFKVSEFTSPSGANSSLPRLFTDNTGTVFLSWVETQDDLSSLYFSKLDDGGWSKPEMISQSSNWFVNWADFPSVIARDGKAIAAHWLKKTEGGTYAYNVEIVSSKNGWDKSITPHNDNTATEHGFVSMVPTSDSAFLSIWLDGRNTAGHGSHDTDTEGSDLTTAMTLRSAVLDLDLNILNEFEIDNSVCDCCGTAAVQTKNGFITAYRNRTGNEIRDIYVSRFVDGKWNTPKAVSNDNWEIAACPVNGPAIDSNGKTVAVSWYTGANSTELVKIAISDDEGETFNESILLSESAPLGRVDLEILDNENILVSWLERNLEDRSKSNFVAKLLNKNGDELDQYTISEMSSSRRSGFPQISSYKNKIIAAWTDLGDGSSPTVKMAILE